MPFVSQGLGGIGRPTAVPLPFCAFLATSSFCASLVAVPDDATVAAVLLVFDAGAKGEGPLLPADVPARSQGLGGGADRPEHNTISNGNCQYKRLLQTQKHQKTHGKLSHPE